MKDNGKPIVASLVWNLPSELHEVQADVVQKLGYEHRSSFLMRLFLRMLE